MAPSFDITVDDNFLICKACGTQFSVDASSGKKDCRICDVSSFLWIESDALIISACFRSRKVFLHCSSMRLCISNVISAFGKPVHIPSICRVHPCFAVETTCHTTISCHHKILIMGSFPQSRTPANSFPQQAKNSQLSPS